MYLSLSMMPEEPFASASGPLFDDALIDSVEWSFDMCWGPSGVPGWLDALLSEYAEAGMLTGHGVSFSLLSGEWTKRQSAWLQRLRVETQLRRYRHISEHVGFVGGGRFSFAAPLPAPYVPSVVALGVARLRLLRAAAGCPIGLENLATSIGRADAEQQGRLLEDLLAPVAGFVILDLHNVWAQGINVGIDPLELVSSYPLERVRAFHVSGGSWDDRSGRRLRRDTHDDRVPDEVLDLMGAIAPVCPNADTVVYERLGTSLLDTRTHAGFQADVRKVRDLVEHL
jgi:uncharacterized protein